MWNKAFLIDSFLLFINRPFQFVVIRLTSLFGKSVRIPQNGYFVNDLKLAKTILKDQVNFASNHTGSLGQLITILSGDIPMLFNMENKEHMILRTKLMSVFNKSYVEQVSEQVLKPILEKEVKKLLEGGELDLVELIHVITNKMTAHMIGVEFDEVKDKDLLIEINHICAQLTKFLGIGKIVPSQKEIDAAMDYYDQIVAIFRKYFLNIDTANKSVMGMLKAQNVPEDIVIGLLIILIVAGTETVSSGLPRGIAALHDSKQWSLLHNSPENVENAIHEIMRFTSPSPAILHSVIKDCEIDGIKFKKDNRVVICQYNILHKSKYNKNADVFDIKREQSNETRFFWFGHGAHYCIGAALAMEEVRVILRELSKPGKNIQITSRKFNRDITFPAYKSLKIKYK